MSSVGMTVGAMPLRKRYLRQARDQAVRKSGGSNSFESDNDTYSNAGDIESDGDSESGGHPAHDPADLPAAPELPKKGQGLVVFTDPGRPSVESKGRK